MIAVDTNILVYAHRPSVPQHEAARAAVEDLIASGRHWAVPWPCVHEFVAVVTSRRAAGTPTPGPDALAAMAALSSRGGAVFLGETRRHLELLEELLTPPAVSGAVVHDAKIAAICLGHGVDELWTADRDYGYFPALSTRNPLVSR